MSQWDPSEWQYRGEGNANLVLIYRGCNSELRGKALRLQKIKPDTCANTLDCSEKAATCLETLEKVFAPLLGEQYVTFMKAVELPKEFLESVKEKSQRKGDCNELARYGLLCQDLFGGPVAVEIKPKWGFMPRIDGQKQKTCRFCMHSHLRGSHSHYCPLDLYSGDRSRVKTALDALLTTPRNNFRVVMNEPFTHEALVALLTEILVSDPILPKLVKLQRSLDELDVETIWPMYEKHKDKLENLSLDDWVQAVSHFQSQTNRDDRKQRIMEYVLSMTFKDCSVIVSIGASADNQIEWYLDDRWLSTTYSIKVIDLDLKRVDRVEYWYELDRTITKHAIQTQFNRQCQNV